MTLLTSKPTKEYLQIVLQNQPTHKSTEVNVQLMG